jgi:O-antigen/teichoic acid export membrane protein
MLMLRVLHGELRVGDTAVVKLSRHLIWVILGFILIQRGFGVFGLIYASIAGWIAVLVWAVILGSTPFGAPSYTYIRSLFDYSKYKLVTDIGRNLYSWMDIIVIGFFLTQTDVGGYEVAWRVSTLGVLFSKATGSVIFPQISEWHAEGKTDEIERLLPEVLFPILFIIIPAFFGVLLLSEELLGVIFGSEYTFASLVLIILMGEKILQAVNVVMIYTLLGIDRPDLEARGTAVAIVLNVLLNVVLVVTVGLIGAAIATTVSYVVNTYLHKRYVERHLTLGLPYRELSWSLVGVGVMSVVVIWLKRTLVIETVPVLLFVVAMGALTYLSVAASIDPLRTRLRSSIEIIS